MPPASVTAAWFFAESAAEVGSNVTLGATRRDGIPEDLTDALLRAMSGLMLAARLDMPERRKHIGRRDLVNRPSADMQHDEFRDHPPRFRQRDRCDLLGLLLQPFVRDGLESHGASLLVRLAASARIDPIDEHPPSLIPTGASALERDIRVDAEAEAALLALVAVLEPPPPTPVRIHEQEQPATVEHLQRLVHGLRRADLDISQRHLPVTPESGHRAWGLLPELPPRVSGCRWTAKERGGTKRL